MLALHHQVIGKLRRVSYNHRALLRRVSVECLGHAHLSHHHRDLSDQIHHNNFQSDHGQCMTHNSTPELVTF